MRIENDQQELISFIKQKNFNAAWNIVKFVGYKDVNDIQERYLIFNHVVNLFDPEINNNFIQMYKQYLRYKRFNINEDFIFNNCRSVVHKIKSEQISPTQKPTNLVKDLMKWKVYLNV